MRHGFLLGKFMPPHAGHMRLCEAAEALCDRLTILVCSLPDDPVPGPLRLEWMRALFPRARVIGHDAVVPQAPHEHPDFWPIWRAIVREAHPEPIDVVFAGEDYGARLAAELGAEFALLGPRWTGDASGTDVRADPWAHWHSLPPPVRGHFAQTICLHGPESSGKTMLAERLARHFDTCWVPEFGRFYCLARPPQALVAADLKAIADAQSAAIAAARRWCNRRVFADTDRLMTAAWSRMLLGGAAEGLGGAADANLYLLLGDHAPFVDDGTRCFGEPEQRRTFFAICEDELRRAGATYASVHGDWEERFRQAVAAVEALPPPTAVR